MGESGYNSPGSSTWHIAQHCSGGFFSGFEEMDETVAKNRGLSPCGNCCGGEWPTDAEESERSADKWAEEAAEDGAAIKLTKRSWNGPEWATIDSEGDVYRYPVGLDWNVSRDGSRDPFDNDAEDSHVQKRVVDVTEEDVDMDLPDEFIDAATEDDNA